MVSAHLYLLLVAAVACERVVELVVSARNARWAFAHGGRESGIGHYRFMQLFHGAFLAACVAEVFALERPFVPLLGWTCIVAVAAAQALRWWAVTTLGPRWNTRVIVAPGEPVTSGPYRFVRHPNYVAVMVEILALPLVHGAWLTAIVFGLGNVALLVVRIRVEEAALGSTWATAFARAPRFVPGGSRE